MDYKEIKGTIYDFSDTSKMRGCWLKLLIDTSSIESKEEAKFVCKQIRVLQEKFPCENCKKHFGEYLTTHPPEVVKNVDGGLFNWVVDFMNSVNKRLGKEQYDKYRLNLMFYDPDFKFCNKECGEPDVKEETIPKRPVKHTNPYKSI